jgi:hypothetical protein
MDKLKEKLNKVCSTHAECANENGSSTLSVADYRGWDRDLWIHRNAITEKLKSMGFQISESFKWDVLDITITKKIKL